MTTPEESAAHAATMRQVSIKLARADAYRKAMAVLMDDATEKLLCLYNAEMAEARRLVDSLR